MSPIALILFLTFAAAPTGPGQAGDAALRIDGETPPHPQWRETVMPGETLAIAAPGHRVEIDGEPVRGDWTAPQTPGHHRLTAEARGDGTDYAVTVFVLQPAAEIDARGYLEGYRIGTYPRDRPEGFIRFEAGDGDVPVSPSFTLGQFLCKQQPGHYPKFLLVTEPMLVRLERLLAELRADGITEAETLFVMSGFRTPFYNTAIGSARLSRHMYGDASDVFVDVDPRDGVMDDVNADNRVTKADANFVYDLAGELFAGLPDIPAGGLGAYGANAAHGPFVHVDGRGRAARWGR